MTIDQTETIRILSRMKTKSSRGADKKNSCETMCGRRGDSFDSPCRLWNTLHEEKSGWLLELSIFASCTAGMWPLVITPGKGPSPIEFDDLPSYKPPVLQEFTPAMFFGLPPFLYLWLLNYSLKRNTICLLVKTQVNLVLSSPCSGDLGGCILSKWVILPVKYGMKQGLEK